MNEPRQLLQNLLAAAERIDGPEAWVHLCLTAANEAASHEEEAMQKPAPSFIAQAVEHMRKVPTLTAKSWEAELLIGLGEMYVKTSGFTPGGQDGRGMSAAAIAYRNALPPITNRRSIQSFVACVAAGVLRRYIDGRDANTLLYAAQAALTAYPKRRPRKDIRAK